MALMKERTAKAKRHIAQAAKVQKRSIVSAALFYIPSLKTLNNINIQTLRNSSMRNSQQYRRLDELVSSSSCTLCNA